MDRRTVVRRIVFLALFGMAQGASAVEPGPVDSLAFVLLEGGAYTLGDETGLGRENERPARPVRVSPFEIRKYEVTVAQFAQFVRETGHLTSAERRGFVVDIDAGMGTLLRREGVSWKAPGFPQSQDHPVVWVDWEDADSFARWMSRRTGRTHRLPTEAEWEFAAKGGASHRWAGTPDESALREFAWHEANSGGVPHPVGTRTANRFGIHDLSGNVWEWCADGFEAYLPSAEVLRDPRGPEGPYRALRGGSWRVGPEVVTTTYRSGYRTDYSHGSIGFRLVREPAP